MLHEERYSGKQHQINMERDILNTLAPKSGSVLILHCMSFPHLHSKNVIDKS